MSESDDQDTSSEDNSRRWSIISRTPVYKGIFQIDKVVFSHDLHAGGHSECIQQELFTRGHVVGVLPYDPDTNRVALVEQFRLGAMHQKPDPWLTEVIAGTIETGESPETAARREALEEAGIELLSLHPITRYLISPGVSADEVHLYFAEADLSNIAGLYGLAPENEDIRVFTSTVSDALAMLDTQKLSNALSIVALQWLKIHH